MVFCLLLSDFLSMRIGIENSGHHLAFCMHDKVVVFSSAEFNRSQGADPAYLRSLSVFGRDTQTAPKCQVVNRGAILRFVFQIVSELILGAAVASVRALGPQLQPIADSSECSSLSSSIYSMNTGVPRIFRPIS